MVTHYQFRLLFIVPTSLLSFRAPPRTLLICRSLFRIMSCVCALFTSNVNRRIETDRIVCASTRSVRSIFLATVFLSTLCYRQYVLVRETVSKPSCNTPLNIVAATQPRSVSPPILCKIVRFSTHVTNNYRDKNKTVQVLVREYSCLVGKFRINGQNNP